MRVGKAMSEAALGAGAVHSLLALLLELDRYKDACQAREHSEFSVGPILRQQLAVARKERLARFLRLQSPNGSSSSSTTTPHARGTRAAPSGRGVKRRLLHTGASRPLSPGG